MERKIGRNFTTLTGGLSSSLVTSPNPIQDGPFRDCPRMVGQKGTPPSLPKNCHTYPTMMKLGTVIDYLTGNQQILIYQEIQI